MGSSTQPGQVETRRTIGRCFRLPGHEPLQDMVMLPLEVVGGGIFMRQAHETFHVNKLQTESRRGVEEIEHGLNLDGGQ